MNKSALGLISSLILIVSSQSMAQSDRVFGWAAESTPTKTAKPASEPATTIIVKPVTESASTTWQNPVQTTTPKIEIVNSAVVKTNEAAKTTEAAAYCSSWECNSFASKTTVEKQMRDINELIPEPIRLDKTIDKKAESVPTTQKSIQPAQYTPPPAPANTVDRFILEYENVLDEGNLAEEENQELTVSEIGKTSYADKFMSKRHVGLRFGKYRCAEGLRNSLEAAGLVKRRHPLQQKHAKDWGLYLAGGKGRAGNGFKNLGPRSKLCKLPGVIRVYGGAEDGYSMGTPGDTSGHVEMVGTDGRYYSSGGKGTAKPINERIKNGKRRRPLTGCYIKESEIL